MTTAFGPSGRLPDTGHDPLPEPLDAADDADLDPVDHPTELARLKAELADDVTVESPTFPVPTRPGWAVTYSAGFDGDDVKEWARRARDRKAPTGVDQLRLACILLANTCQAVRKNDQPLTEDGEDLTFRSPELQAIYGTKTAAETVRLFYGGPRHQGDGHILAHSQELLKLAGFDADVERLDPTPS